MKTATIRDLRTRFPSVRRELEREGEIVVTERGRPIVVLRPYEKAPAAKKVQLDYFARLRRRMPKPLTARARRTLDEADRGER